MTTQYVSDYDGTSVDFWQFRHWMTNVECRPWISSITVSCRENTALQFYVAYQIFNKVIDVDNLRRDCISAFRCLQLFWRIFSHRFLRRIVAFFQKIVLLFCKFFFSTALWNELFHQTFLTSVLCNFYSIFFYFISLLTAIYNCLLFYDYFPLFCTIQDCQYRRK